MEEFSCPNNCNRRGTCRQGFCHCKEGYWGRDCSRSKAYAAPALGQDHPVAYGQLKVYVYELPWQVGGGWREGGHAACWQGACLAACFDQPDIQVEYPGNDSPYKPCLDCCCCMHAAFHRWPLSRATPPASTTTIRSTPPTGTSMMPSVLTGPYAQRTPGRPTCSMCLRWCSRHRVGVGEGCLTCCMSACSVPHHPHISGIVPQPGGRHDISGCSHTSYLQRMQHVAGSNTAGSGVSPGFGLLGRDPQS